MLSISSRPLYSLLGVLLLAGCAGGTFSRSDTALPKELAPELKEKFEVKDEEQEQAKAKSEFKSLPASPWGEAPAPKASPSPAIAKKVSDKIPVAATTASAKKRAKHAKKDAAASPVPGATPTPTAGSFVYPERRPAKDPLWVGEEQVFEITYFGVPAGDFTLDVLPYKYINDRKVYYVHGTAVSSSVFNLFYRLNDQIETFIDFNGIFSHRFHIVLDETKQTRDSIELNDSEKKTTYYWNRWNHKDKGKIETKDYYPIQPFPQDSLSALYYLRTVPLPPGAVVTFPVVSEGKTWEAVVTVVRREMLDTVLGRVQTIVLKPETKYQGILKKQGDSFIWMTDDDRRFVVRIEAKVRIGTVTASLKKVERGSPP